MSWIPKTEAELQELLVQGALEESATLELKREVGGSQEVAKDIAAMANDGGVILYGVAEDGHGQPGALTPFPLAGVAEKVDAIAGSAISETPRIEIRTIPSEAEEGKGYLAVIVPPSIRAPHMVVVKGHNRFYGRSAKGNMPLTEGDVARLYQRRQQAQTDAQKLLDELISHAPPEAAEGGAWLHLVARPMLPRETLVEEALANARHPFDELIREGREEGTCQSQYEPWFSEQPARSKPYGWLLQMGSERRETKPREPHEILDLRVEFDGRLELSYGNAADRLPEPAGFQIFDKRLADLTVCFLRFAGGLYNRASYLGQVQLGVAISSIRGARSRGMIGVKRIPDCPEFEDDQFTRTKQLPAPSLKNQPREVAQDLLDRFFRALTQGQYNPLEIDQVG